MAPMQTLAVRAILWLQSKILCKTMDYWKICASIFCQD